MGEQRPEHVPKRVVDGRASGGREEVHIGADVVVVEHRARGVGLDEPLEQVVRRDSEPAALLEPLTRSTSSSSRRAATPAARARRSPPTSPHEIAPASRRNRSCLAARGSPKSDGHHEPGQPERERSDQVDDRPAGPPRRPPRPRRRLGGAAGRAALRPDAAPPAPAREHAVSPSYWANVSPITVANHDL